MGRRDPCGVRRTASPPAARLWVWAVSLHLAHLLPSARSFSTAGPATCRSTPFRRTTAVLLRSSSAAAATTGSEPRGEAAAPETAAGAGKRHRRSNDDLQRASDGDVDVAAYASGYATVFGEVPFRICEPSDPASHPIPGDLRGSYFRAGPAMFSAGSIVPPKTSIVQPKVLPVPDGTDPSRMVLHPLEGDGAVLGITFTADGNDGDGATDGSPTCAVLRYRYVRTPGFTNERKKGQRLYKGMDATRLASDDASGLGNDFPLPLFRHHLQPGLNKNRKHAANTRAVYFGKRLFALWEGGQPYKLDGLAVSTEGRSQLGGAVKKDTDPLSGKMAYDAASNSALFYGVQHGPAQSELTLYEFDSNFRLVPGGRTSAVLPGFALVTDFAVTPNYAVFLLPNVACNPVQFLVNKDPGKVLTVDPTGGGSAVLVPRVSGARASDPPIVVPIPADALASDAHVLFINAYEEDTASGAVIVDAIRSDGSSKSKSPLSSSSTSWPWATTLDEYQSQASRKSLWRYTIDPKKRAVSKKPWFDAATAPHVDFGVVNPVYCARRHRYLYSNVGRAKDGAAAPMQGVLKLDTETGESQVWMPERHQFCGEPMYAPRSGESDSAEPPEDGGYLLTVLYDGRRRESELVVLLASDVAAGPVTRIPLGMAVPHGYFGCFTAAPEARWSPDEIERRAKLTDKVESRGNRWNEVKSDFSGLGLRLDDMEEYFGDFFS